MREIYLIVFEGSSEHEEPHGISSALAADSFDGCSVIVEDSYTELFSTPEARAVLDRVGKNDKFVVVRMTPRDAQRIQKARVVEDYRIVAVHAV